MCEISIEPCPPQADLLWHDKRKRNRKKYKSIKFSPAHQILKLPVSMLKKNRRIPPGGKRNEILKYGTDEGTKSNFGITGRPKDPDKEASDPNSSGKRKKAVPVRRQPL
jgi:hypothetical protein